MEKKGVCAQCSKCYEENQDLSTTFHNAVESGHTECMQWFIAEGADVNNVNKDGNTPLITAASMNLYPTGADTKARKVKCVELLIEEGADVNKTDSDGETALYRCNNAKCSQLLIEAGADVNFKMKDGQTALHLAGLCGNKNEAKLLIKSGTDVNCQNNDGETALHLASLNGNSDIVKLLITAGGDVNITDEGGSTSLINAAMDYNFRRSGEICLEILLHAGAKISVIDSYGDAVKNHMIHEHTQTGQDYEYNERTCKLLLAAGETKTLHRSHLKSFLNKDSGLGEFALQEMWPCLKHLCRKAIRNHLLDLDEHGILFNRVHKLGLPTSLAQYLVYNVPPPSSYDVSDSDSDSGDE